MGDTGEPVRVVKRLAFMPKVLSSGSSAFKSCQEKRSYKAFTIASASKAPGQTPINMSTSACSITTQLLSFRSMLLWLLLRFLFLSPMPRA